MSCSNCGHEKDEKANFRKNCGSSVSANKSPAPINQQPLTPPSFKEYIKKKGVASPTSSSDKFEKADTSAFENIKKRKKNKRLNQIKKDKKDEFVKVKDKYFQV